MNPYTEIAQSKSSTELQEIIQNRKQNPENLVIAAAQELVDRGVMNNYDHLKAEFTAERFKKTRI